MKGQTSMELITIVALVVALTFIVGTKYLNAQGEVFIDSSARQAFISESSKLDIKYYLKKTESIECENEVKVNYITDPVPTGADLATLTTNIGTIMGTASGVQGRTPTITFNSNTLTCT